MRKLWCLEGEKIGEKNSDGILNFFFLKMKWREFGNLKGRERERIFGQSKEATSPIPVGGVWATRDQRGPLAVGPTVRIMINSKSVIVFLTIYSY